jgi:hypothetical protein
MADNDNGTRSEKDVRNDNRADESRPDEGQAARRAKIREGDEFAIAGNARERDEDPSPDDRERGETSIKDTAAPVDINR